ncbi:cold shock domain-containing protein [Streptomyces triticagri]|uniref:Cold shock domain-containing protein n=1 Tax=Streptomyces triticagri TaxID=2293568 RepID=A0A372MC60_9ACTN|nr:cold shock domain-containing protein [Streptomyces triticagri]RFU87983.1 cold shock domain-containing protein [Streptomyces triticagri]
MVAGRVVRFDGARGYGFIAPDDGSEDVFLHVNDLLIPEHQLHPGLIVEFDIEEGDRGLKASSVKLAAGSRAPAHVSAAQPKIPGALTYPGSSRAADGDDSLCDVLTSDEYVHEVTEVLLATAPALTGDQIVKIRQGLLQFAKNHGWTED